MHHGMADLDAGRIAVDQDTAHAALEDREQRAGVGGVGLVHLDGRRELAFELLRHGPHGGDVRAADHQRGGAEHFLRQGRIGREGVGVGDEQGGLSLVRAVLRGALGDLLDLCRARQAVNAFLIGFANAGRQHGRGRGCFDGGFCRGEEFVERRACNAEDEAGIGAELPRAERQRADEFLPDVLRAGGKRVRHQEHRIDAAHLGIDGDRLGTRRRRPHQRRAAGPRSGEAHRLDVRMLDQRRADLRAGAEQHREHAFRQPAGFDRLLHRAADEFGCAGMRGVGFDDDRTASRKRRGGIAAGDRKGEREIARAEHRDRADGDMALAEIGARQRLAVGHRRVDTGIDPAAFAHNAREQPQLADRAAALAFETRARQSAFRHGALDQRIADVHDRLGDRLQKGGPRLQAGFPVGVEGGPGEVARPLDLLAPATAEARLHLLAGRRIGGAERRRASPNRSRTDDHVSCGHFKVSSETAAPLLTLCIPDGRAGCHAQ